MAPKRLAFSIRGRHSPALPVIRLMIPPANKGRVYFSLKGEFDPAELSEFLGITPSNCRGKGERDPERSIPRSSIWDFSSPQVEGISVDVYQLAEQVIDPLLPHTDRIAEAVRRWDLAATLQVVLEFAVDESISTPAIGFDPRIVQFLAEVGAGIDIDTYLLGPDESPPTK